jgi:flagellar biosynthesis/type III secretory pathway protein FliH
LPKVIRQTNTAACDQVVQIPDAPPAPPPAPLKTDEADTVDFEEQAQQEQLPEVSPQQLAEEQAKELTKRLMQTARGEGERILQAAREEAEKLRQDAVNEGYRQALEEKQQEISTHLTELDTLMQTLQKNQEAFFESYQDGLATLSIEIAQKVLGSLIREQETLLLPLVEQAMATVKNEEWITVQVSERMPVLVDYLKRDLLAAGNTEGRTVEVQAADLPEGSCLIQTPEGVLDASVQTQLDNLKTMFDRTNRVGD